MAIRSENPYGPNQRPDGVLGAVTTFTSKAINCEEITVFGDGSVVRYFIYIDDAISATKNVIDGGAEHHVFNLGCGCRSDFEFMILFVNWNSSKSVFLVNILYLT